MKKKIILVFTVLLAIFLVGCPNAPSNNVPEEEASSLKASGATLVPTSGDMLKSCGWEKTRTFIFDRLL